MYNFISLYIHHTQAQKSRIATLFFPLVPIIIKHSSKLNRKPKNESHTQHPQTNVVSEPVSPATPISISGNEETVHVSTGVKRSLVSEFSSSMCMYVCMYVRIPTSVCAYFRKLRMYVFNYLCVIYIIMYVRFMYNWGEAPH